jgi:hypothetical protein
MRPDRGYHGATSILLAGFVALLGCTTPELTRRYRSIDTGGGANCRAEPSIAVSTFVMDPERSGNPAVAGLSDRGQEALITGLTSKTSNAADLLRAMNLAQDGGGIVIERSKFKRRIVVAVNGLDFGPADRIQRMSVNLALGPEQAAIVKFTSWDKLVTKYDTVDLGTLKLSKGSTFEATADLTPPQIKEIAGIGLGYTSNRTLDEAINLRRRINALSGRLSATEATLFEEGEVGLDLTGNTVVDVELEAQSPIEVPIFQFTNLRDAKGAPSAPEAVVANPRWIRMPQKPGDITLKVRADYVVRHVESGADTIMEGDDRVRLVSSSVGVTEDPTLIPRRMMELDIFALKIQSGDDKNGRMLHIAPGRAHAIFFESYESALEFQAWLRDASSQKVVDVIGRTPINLGPTDDLEHFVPLTKDDLAHFIIDRRRANP